MASASDVTLSNLTRLWEITHHGNVLYMKLYANVGSTFQGAGHRAVIKRSR